MSHTDAPLNVGAAPAHQQIHRHPPGADGVRLVTRENGRYVDLMPSPSSSYLLPTLADCSLVRREARTPIGSLRFYSGGVVEVEETAEGSDLRHFGDSAVFVSVVLAGLGSFGASTGSSFDQFGPLNSSLGRLLSPSELIARTATPPASFARGTLMPVITATGSAAVSVTVDPVDDFAAHERVAAETSPAPDASIAAVASRIAALSGLSDELLAELFKVERETFCRWRTGRLTNPRVGNRRRLGLLLALLEDLAGRKINIKNWLLNHATPHGLTPYELLAQGRIDEVAFLAASIGEPDTERDMRSRVIEDPEPLEFGEDDVWDLQPLEDDEP